MKKAIILTGIISVLFFWIITGFKSMPEPVKKIETQKSFHDFVVKDINGKDFNLAKLKGKRVMVVNTASKCGLTPQFATLQKLYESCDTSKFMIIAFPSNNFKEQDPGSNADIKDFCTKNYGVTFPVMAKVSVCNYIYQSYPIDTLKATKTTTDEIYQWLTQKSKNGVMDIQIKWNFQKILIDENGKLMGTLPPNFGDEILLLKKWFAM